jgi:hypothetical protein
MKITVRMTLVIAAVALSYAAGRAGVFAGDRAIASVQQMNESEQSRPSLEMQAAAEFGSPSKHHRVLDVLIGTFSGEFIIRTGPDAPPTTTRGTVTREWVLDGRYVREIVRAEGETGPFEGIGYIGYDNFDGQYEMVWMDSASTGIEFDTGNFHPDEKVMHVRESRRDPVTGRLVNAWSKLDLSDPDRHTMVGYATDIDGRTYRAVEGTLERED